MDNDTIVAAASIGIHRVYRCNGELNFGWGVRSSPTEFPDFAGIHEDSPDFVILSINEIDAEQAVALNGIIEKKRQES